MLGVLENKPGLLEMPPCSAHLQEPCSLLACAGESLCLWAEDRPGETHGCLLSAFPPLGRGQSLWLGCYSLNLWKILWTALSGKYLRAERWETGLGDLISLLFKEIGLSRGASKGDNFTLSFHRGITLTSKLLTRQQYQK